MLGEFEIVARLRPIALVSPGSAIGCPVGSLAPLPRPAPYACIQAMVSPRATTSSGAPIRERVELVLASGEDRLVGWWDPLTGRVGLEVTTGARTTTHVSRRWGHLPVRPQALALALTGSHLTLFGALEGQWQAHARYDLSGRVDVHHPTWAQAIQAGAHESQRDTLSDVVGGGFGQLGLRDLRLVTELDGSPLRRGELLVLSATSAGPGFFDTAHTSLWSLDPHTYALTHLSDLYFLRRGEGGHAGVYGDHATHVVRDGDSWMVATSTWGDFDAKSRPVRVVLAQTAADLMAGEHLLEARELPLPTEGFRSVGVWDPHLLLDGDLWRVGYVSARKYFTFHPVLAEGATLDDLRVSAAATARRATEGTSWLRVDSELRVLASDGRDGAKGTRMRFPIFDTALREIGTLDAPYPTNLPWPTLVEIDEGWLMITFDGAPTGGEILGYGTHGDVVVMRTAPGRRAVTSPDA